MIEYIATITIQKRRETITAGQRRKILHIAKIYHSDATFLVDQGLKRYIAAQIQAFARSPFGKNNEFSKEALIS
jgi:hypothetical protein